MYFPNVEAKIHKGRNKKMGPFGDILVGPSKLSVYCCWAVTRLLGVNPFVRLTGPMSMARLMACLIRFSSSKSVSFNGMWQTGMPLVCFSTIS